VTKVVVVTGLLTQLSPGTQTSGALQVGVVAPGLQQEGGTEPGTQAAAPLQ